MTEPHITDAGLVIHTLKAWRQFFVDVISGRKTFEIRKNDRNFREGDMLVLREWSQLGGYSGRWSAQRVTYIVNGEPFLPADTCVMGIEAGYLGAPPPHLSTPSEGVESQEKAR